MNVTLLRGVFIISVSICALVVSLSNFNVDIGSLTKGIRIKKNIFRTFELMPFIGCLKECLLRTKCKVFTVHTTKLECKLGQSIADTESSTDLSFVTSEPQEWPEYEKLSGSCANHTCAAGTKCVPVKNTTRCVIAECTPPAVIAYTSGQPTDYSVGSTYTYSCRSGYSGISGTPVITCQTDGQWTPQNFVCKAVCNTAGGFTDGVICYKYLNIYKSGWDAAYECKKIGARLAKIDTKAKFDYMNTQTTGYYVDGSDEDEEGVWRYSDGSLVTYTNWIDGYGSRGKNFNCLYLSYSGFYDYNCVGWYTMLCEIR